MPLYEYVCGDCGQPSELLVRGETKPKCPSCDSENLTKQWSVSAAGSPKSFNSCDTFGGNSWG
jgi:putative FmdB family regulatory protein